MVDDVAGGDEIGSSTNAKTELRLYSADDRWY
jgi:hypothetical protein